MNRVKVDLPDQFLFRTEIPVRITDLNYGGHVGNDAMLSLVHEARVQFFMSEGFKSELDIMGLGVIMADVAMQFKGEGFYGNVFEVYVTVGTLSSSGFDLYYKFIDADSRREILRVKTGMVLFDYKSRKIASLPQELKERWQLPHPESRLISNE
ncbi:acyl-CoA thioesterase [Bernardetia sp.]|uniref:acyl-CoA thioesterase n=1 Tax=Bernardetia sp. TaxID=1937974 RepID=UPI0025C1E128|nr:thioesterase family protein [Bernardetia sp.]